MRATVWAASVGQIGAIVLIVVGLAEDFWLVLAGLLVLPAANAELRYALALRHLADRRVCDLMRRELVHIDRSTSISEAAELSVSTPISDFLVTDRGRPVGYLSAPRLWAAVRSDQPGTAPVSTISVDLAGPVPSHADVESAIGFFEPDGPAVAPVVDEGGAAIGVAVRDDLMRAAELARHATRGDS